MYLTEDQVIPHLLDKQVLSPSEVVNETIIVVPMHTRNIMFRVTAGSARSLLVKQASSFEERVLRLSRHEYNAYRLIFSDERYNRLRKFVSGVFHYDLERYIGVFGYMDGTINLHDHYLAAKEFDTSIAVQQAEIFAAYHTSIPAADQQQVSLPRELPWIFRITEWKGAEAFPAEGLKAKLVDILGEWEDVKQSLEHARREWKPSCLIHGDIKWTNYLVRKEGDVLRVFLIDWEAADIGDAAWDVAGFLQAYFAIWIFTCNNVATEATRSFGSAEDFDAEKMKSSITAFWNAYVKKRGLNKATARKLLIRSMVFTGVRLVQTCIEALHGADSITPNHMRCIQAASTLMKDPETALNQLLEL